VGHPLSKIRRFVSMAIPKFKMFSFLTLVMGLLLFTAPVAISQDNKSPYLRKWVTHTDASRESSS